MDTSSLSSLCATCLNSKNLKTVSTVTFDVSYSEKLKVCVPKYVSERFDLGQCYLCERCAMRVDSYYRFLIMAMESKWRLEEMIIGGINVKEKAVEVSGEITGDFKISTDKDPLRVENIEETMLNGNIQMDKTISTTAMLEMKFESIETTNESIDKKFSCVFCCEKFAYYSELRRHNLTHTKRRSFVCECRQKFLKKTDLTAHQKISDHKSLNIETEDKKFVRRFCGEKFQYKNMLQQQTFLHVEYRLFVCECGKEFRKKSDLGRHQVTMNHKNCKIRGRKFRCLTCGETFTNISLYKRHNSEHVKKSESSPPDKKSIKYQCEQCGKLYAGYYTLLQHQMSHTGKKPYKCEICSKTFLRKNAYTLHIESTHKKIHKFTCDICGKGFYQKTKLKIHLDYHNGVKNHNCNICGQGFAYRTTYKHHMTRHGGESQKKFQCTECESRFKSNVELVLHSYTHTDDKPVACEQCGKKFIRNYQLHNHMNRYHLNIRPFSCDICGKSFVRAGELKKHKNVHTDDRPFSCPTCSATFKALSHVNRHVKNNVCNGDTNFKIRKRKMVKSVTANMDNS